MNRLQNVVNHITEGTDPEIVWTPANGVTGRAVISRFMDSVNTKFNLQIRDYESLHRWSVADVGTFWRHCWDFLNPIGRPGSRIMSNESDMMGAKLFPDSQFNFAENCLQTHGDGPAIVYSLENSLTRTLSWIELQASVSALVSALRAKGVKKGDRVCAVVSNIPESIVCMFATASIGAIWSSVSPDFGVEGVLERFGQIRPMVFFHCDVYYNKGKRFDISGKVREMETRLQACMENPAMSLISVRIDDGGLARFSQGFDGSRPIEFEPTNFNDPLFIMFSSGTTGAPKCIVHRHGVLLQLMKEHQLHCDVKPGDRVLYYTTTTWMMWNWLVSALASKATVLLYDGNPSYPDCNSMFRFAADNKCTFFGVSAKFIDSLKSAPEFVSPPPGFETVRTIASTGSALIPESFDFVYERIKRDVNLASICGGTDIFSCFILGCPIKPVKRGFAQCRGLGMDVQIWDAETQSPLIGEKGELVCCKPFPSQPIGFWGDSPDKRKYKEAYFDDFPNVWKHGDFCMIDKDGHVFVYGRSDTTLNPGGVRIGTAEIYRAVETLPFIKESICCGIELKQGDESVALFVTLADSEPVLTEAMKAQIREAVMKSATRHHVPKVVEQVADIPRTKSGKIVELAVKNVLHHRPIKNVNSLVNPGALSLFKPFAVDHS